MDLVANFFSQLIDFVRKYKTYFFLLAISVLAFISYRIYISRLNVQASFQLSNLISSYNKISSDSSSRQSALESIVRRSKELRSKFYMSPVNSLFKLYESQALYDLGEAAQAIESLNSSISGMSDPVFKDLAKVKLLIFKLEEALSQDTDTIQILKDLEKLSFDGKAPADGFANFRLHEYYFIKGDLEKSKIYGTRFIKAYAEPSRNGFGLMNFSQVVNKVKSRMETFI